MKLSEHLIEFQNQAEKEFKKTRNIRTFTRYILALILFIASTVFAFVTIPYRLIKNVTAKPKRERVIVINNKNLDSISKKEPLLLLDFWAEWCGPCIMMNSILDEFMNTNKNLTLGKVNADLNPSLLKKYRIKGIPQFILLREGQEVKRNAGPMTVKELAGFVKE